MTMGLLVVRLRSSVNVRHDIRLTLESLNLTRVNHATIVPDSAVFRGMLQKVKDYVAFGAVDADAALELLAKRGRLAGDRPITDDHLAQHSGHASLKEYATALAEGRARLGDVADIKPIMRLAPPRKGHEGIKHSFRSGGALGDRGERIKDLALRMV